MAQEVSFKQILESNHYAMQKEAVFNATNKAQVVEYYKNSWYAPISSTPSSNRNIYVDHSTFRKTQEERDRIYTEKKSIGKSKHYKFKTVIRFAI
jgi:hypothetical protein